MTDNQLPESSRTATLHFVVRDGQHRVHKIGLGWTNEHVTKVINGHQLWAAALEGVPGVSTPRAQAVEEPPSVLLEFIDGTDFDAVVRTGAACATQLRSCGLALAAYHRHALPSTPGREQLDLTKWRRRLGLPRGLDAALRPVRSAGDFAPYNVRVGTDGEIHILDATTRSRIVTPQRDIAWFLWWYAQAGGPDSCAFLDGYQNEYGDQLLAADHAVVCLYLTVMSLTRARRKLERRDLGGAVRFLRWALQARALAGRCARGRSTVDLSDWRH